MICISEFASKVFISKYMTVQFLYDAVIKSVILQYKVINKILFWVLLRIIGRLKLGLMENTLKIGIYKCKPEH